MELIERLRKPMEDNGREAIDGAHPLSVEAVGSQEPLIFEVCCEPGDESLILGAPCQQWIAPHGYQRVAAVLTGEKPLPEAVTRVVRDADASAITGEGVGHA
jgi:hypothetical protein